MCRIHFFASLAALPLNISRYRATSSSWHLPRFPRYIMLYSSVWPCPDWGFRSMFRPDGYLVGCPMVRRRRHCFRLRHMEQAQTQASQTRIMLALFSQVRIEEIEQTPREHEALPLLADMAAYVGDWHPGCKSLVRSSLVQTPQTWAADLAQQLENAVAEQLEPEIISMLQAKQSMCFMYGVLCFGGSAALSAADVATLCELQILAHNRCVFTEKQELRVERSALLTSCQDVMAGRSREIVHHATRDAEFITSAVRRVIQEVPMKLSW